MNQREHKEEAERLSGSVRQQMERLAQVIELPGGYSESFIASATAIMNATAQLGQLHATLATVIDITDFADGGTR